MLKGGSETLIENGVRVPKIYHGGAHVGTLIDAKIRALKLK